MTASLVLPLLASSLLLGGAFATTSHAAYGSKASLKNVYGTAMPLSQMYGQSGLDKISSGKGTFKGKIYSSQSLGPTIVYATAKISTSSGKVLYSQSNSASGTSTTASKQVSVSTGSYKVNTSHTVEIYISI